MFHYFAKRVGALPLILIGVTLLVFAAMRAIPGDPALITAGLSATEAQLRDVRHHLGLDRPLYVQYGLWLERLAHGDFGRSIVTGRPVLAQLVERFLNTLQLTLAGLVFAVPIGLLGGILAAVRHNSALDYGTMTGALLGISMPTFWLGLMLILFFSVELRWLPVGGKGGLAHVVLPAATLGLFSLGLIARMTRSSMLEVLREEYVLVARAKGLKSRSVILIHALRNALLPIMTVIGLQIGYGMAGAVITEQVFAWPGVGRLLVDAIFRRDYPMVQGAVLFIATSFVLVNLTIDMLYGLIDPRIRFQ